MKNLAFPIFLISISGFSLLIHNLQNYHHKNISAISSAAMAGIAQLEGSTSIASGEILNKVKLQNQIPHQNHHGLHSALKAISDDYNFSRISFFNGNCEVIATSEKGMLLDSACKESKGPFLWKTEENTASLFRIEPTTAAGKAVTLAIKVTLDKNWLEKTIPMSLFEKYNIELLNTKQPFPMIPLAPQLELKVSSWTLPFNFLSRQPHDGWLYLAILGLSIICYQQSRQIFMRLREQNQSEAQMKICLANLLGDASLERKDLSWLQSEIKSQWALMDFDYRQQIKSQRDIISRNEQTIIDLKKNLSKLKSQESLQEQISGGARQFLELNGENQSKLEDVADVINRGILPPCQQLYTIIKSWHSGLQSSSPRKHFRSLSERDIGEGLSQLDQDIANLLGSCQQVGNLSMQLGVHSQKLLGQMKQGHKVAQHWLEMIDPSGTPKDLNDTLLDAQILVPLTENLPNLKFENHIDHIVSIDHIDAQPSAWTSIIYHAYLSVIESSDHQGEALALHSSSYSKGGKTILIITARTKNTAKQQIESGKRHLTLAQEVGRNLGIEVFTLPILEGDVPIAICWPDYNSKPSSSSKIPSRSNSSSALPSPPRPLISSSNEVSKSSEDSSINASSMEGRAFSEAAPS